MAPLPERVDINDFAFGLRDAPVGLRGYSAREVSDMTGLDTGPETLVQQHFADEVDVNTIVRRFGITRAMPLGKSGEGLYGDFTEITDYESALERVKKVEEGFMKLPPDVRERFENNPGKLIEFAHTLVEDDFRSEVVVEEPVVEAPPAVGS